MDIIGEKAYLNVTEQIKSELSSPIEFSELDVVACLRDSQGIYQDAFDTIHADPNEGLPHERANAIKQMVMFEQRSRIYRRIVDELVTQRKLDTRIIETL